MSRKTGYITPHPVLLPQSRLGEIAAQNRQIRQRIWQGEGTLLLPFRFDHRFFHTLLRGNDAPWLGAELARRLVQWRDCNAKTLHGQLSFNLGPTVSTRGESIVNRIDLENRCAIVTGGARGIGLAIAERF